MKNHPYIWHPFTQHGLETEFFHVKSGKGAWLTLEDGKPVLDAISSWWTTLHGHAHPFIANAIYEQAKTLEHVIFAGFTHEPAIKLAETLVHATHNALTRCFYSDNGSTAVEVAMKMAYQYHQNRGDKKRNRFLSLTNAYHGDTLGSMALSARNSYHQRFNELLPSVDFIDPCNSNFLVENVDQYAALIVEPLVQGAAGMRMHTPQDLHKLVEICKAHQILLICDEVFTGFYRTGACFAFLQADIQPDFLCLAKGLTGGFLPLAVTLTTEGIFEAFSSRRIEDAFLHGHSYTANPLACRAALASWELLQMPETQDSIKRIARHTETLVKELSAHPNVKEARSLGTIGAIETKNAPVHSAKIRQYALQHQVLLRPLGSVLYTVVPYCVTNKELEHIYQTIAGILDNWENLSS